MNRYQDWINQALRDLERAKIDLQYAYWEWACFTSQQAAEKAVKSLLMWRGDSAWGHAITPMLRSMIDVSSEQILVKSQLLDSYYIPARYPNGFAEGKPSDYFNEQIAREAVDAASEIIRFCQDHLPEPG